MIEVARKKEVKRDEVTDSNVATEKVSEKKKKKGERARKIPKVRVGS